jgi:hypothetical protein
MATSRFSLIAKMLIVTAGLTGATVPDAVAQVQLQGNFPGSTRPGPPQPPAENSQASKQAKIRECAAQGKDQGLKGRELRVFQKSCVDGTLPAPPATATQPAPEPSPQPTAK